MTGEYVAELSTCIASMGRKKKQVEPVKEISQNSQGGPIANDSKRIDNLENKLDKILDSMAAIEDRVKKQEGRGARPISPQFFEEIG